MTAASPYPLSARLLHRLALADPAVQRPAAELEARLFANELAAVTNRHPVYVAGLPRAGTTLLLELLAGLPEMATHTYRDMPFVLAPLLWEGLAGRFRRPAEAAPRAHGDGLLVHHDSPEAFEEIVWRAWWPAHYAADRIRPWPDDVAATAFAPFLRRHMRAVVARRGRDRPETPPSRYLAKANNAIARLGLLGRIVPDAVVLVPVRPPLAQARSLANQHRRFLERHDADPFSRWYMAALGHYEFGRCLRPLDMGGWLDAAPPRDARHPDFWLAYWTAAHDTLLATAPANVRFVAYEHLCTRPRTALESIGAAVGANTLAPLMAGADRIQPPPDRDDDTTPDPALLEAAEAVHARVLARDVVDG